MRYQYLAVPLLAFAVSGYAQSAPVNKKNVSLPAQDKGAANAFDDRSTDVTISNELLSPTSAMDLVGKGINSGWDSGEWKKNPPAIIGSYLEMGKAGTTSDTWLHGAGGWVKYKVRSDGTILTFRWVNPYTGSNGYHVSASNDGLYSITRQGGSGNNAAVTFTVTRKAQPALLSYSAVIMADPQPWRLSVSGDPNSDSKNGAQWRAINQKNLKSVLSLPDVKFAIVNGDLTEYGRQAQYDDYSKIYHGSGLFIAEGLGNHDYANNVGDCMSAEYGFGTTKDGCALSAVEREYNAIQNIKNNMADISGSAFSSDAERLISSTKKNTFKGSLAYSWDVGDIHYVQLQNYPTYTVHLTSSLDNPEADITGSLDWLATDLERADLRGKTTVINFHDARPVSSDGDSHFLNKNNLTELSRFKSIITSHNVKAIFVGHTHQQAYCRAKDDVVFGSIPVYTSGALFNGDYYLIHVQGGSIDVKAYNGASGQPVLVKDLGTVGSDAVFSTTCSKL